MPRAHGCLRVEGCATDQWRPVELKPWRPLKNSDRTLSGKELRCKKSKHGPRRELICGERVLNEIQEVMQPFIANGNPTRFLLEVQGVNDFYVHPCSCVIIPSDLGSDWLG